MVDECNCTNFQVNIFKLIGLFAAFKKKTTTAILDSIFLVPIIESLSESRFHDGTVGQLSLKTGIN